MIDALNSSPDHLTMTTNKNEIAGGQKPDGTKEGKEGFDAVLMTETFGAGGGGGVGKVACQWGIGRG